MKSFTMPLMIMMVALLSLATFQTDGLDTGNQIETLAGGRLVFVEDITATWCGYCPAASEALVDLSNERSDFRFITLVDDRVPEAATRNEEFNPSGFPTVMFDGGYEEVIGAPSSSAAYDDAIDSCVSRDVPSLDVSVDCFDEGGSKLRIDVEITNNDDEDYSGRLLINVVEIVSRYLDADGNNYPYSLIGYAADETVNIGSGNTFASSANWIGSDNSDLNGDDFSDIDAENIVIYASVVNGDSNYKVRQSFPPSYYTAYYVDAVGEAFPEELTGAPVVTIKSPRNGRTVSEDVEIEAEVASETDIEEVEVKIGQDNWEEMDVSGDMYLYSWDTTTSNNGLVKISVRATDRYDLTGIVTIEVNVQNENVATPPEIVDISHTPAIVYDGELVIVEVEVMEYDTSISSVKLAYCVGDICEIPIEMDPAGSSIYTLEIGPFQDGDYVEYDVEVTDSEGNRVKSSKMSFDVQSRDTQDDTDDDDDDSPTPTEPQTDDSPSPFLLMAPVGVLIAIVVMRRKK